MQPRELDEETKKIVKERSLGTWPVDTGRQVDPGAKRSYDLKSSWRRKCA
jgi:hypothetical protein